MLSPERILLVGEACSHCWDPSKLIFVFILLSPQGKCQFGSVLVTVGAACGMSSGQICFGGTPAEWDGLGGMSPPKNERAECEVLTSYLENI